MSSSQVLNSTMLTSDNQEYIMDVVRICAENPLLPSPSSLLNPNGKTTEALYYIQTTMNELDPQKKGLSGKDIIHHVTETEGKLVDAGMKRQIRAELVRGVRNGDLGYVEDEYTRRKYYIL